MEEKVTVKRPTKSPGLAGVLSAFFPFGAGAFYNGQYAKGLIYLFVFAGLVTIQGHGKGQPFAGLLLAGFYIFQIIDSVHTARAMNRLALQPGAEEAPKVEEFPQELKTGSIFWGLVLVALGAIFLLANFNVISYDTIFDFWPVAVIVIGLKLIVDYFARKK
jgi:TM2 domain-containing membrane protein YozV